MIPKSSERTSSPAVPKEAINEFEINPQNIYNMDEKGFLLGLLQHSMRVIVKAPEKAAFLRQPGQRGTISVIEAVSAFGQRSHR